MATSQDILKHWQTVQLLYKDPEQQQRAMANWAEKNGVSAQQFSDTFGGTTDYWQGIAEKWATQPENAGTVGTQGGTNSSTGSNYTLDQVKQLWTSNSGTRSMSDSAAQTYLDQLNSGSLSESQLTQRARNHGIANGFIQTDQTQQIGGGSSNPYSFMEEFAPNGMNMGIVTGDYSQTAPVGEFIDQYIATHGMDRFLNFMDSRDFLRDNRDQILSAYYGGSNFQQGATDQGMLTGSTGAPTAATGLMGILEQGAGAYGGADNWFRAMYDEVIDSGMSTEQALAIAQEYNPNVTAEDMSGYFADNNLVDPTAYLFQDGGVNPDQGQRYVDYINSLDLTDEQKQQLLSSAAETSGTDTAAYTDPTTGLLGAYGSYMNQVNGYNPVNAQALARNTIRAGEESLSDYYGRLAMERPGGILGQGLMTSAPTPGSDAWTSQVVSDMFPELAGNAVGGNTVGTRPAGDGGSSGTPIDWSDPANLDAAFERYGYGADWKEQALSYLMPLGIGELGILANDQGAQQAVWDYLTSPEAIARYEESNRTIFDNSNSSSSSSGSGGSWTASSPSYSPGGVGTDAGSGGGYGSTDGTDMSGAAG